MALKSGWLWLPAFESFEGAPVLTGHLSDLFLRRQNETSLRRGSTLAHPGGRRLARSLLWSPDQALAAVAS